MRQDYYQTKQLEQILGDVSFANSNTNFEIKRFRPKTEYLKIIDDYFTRFGYKIERVKVPEINSRKVFNYIEIRKIRIFRIWKYPSKFFN